MNEIYWITRLDSISCFIGIWIVVSGIISIISFIFWANTYNDESFDNYNMIHKLCIRFMRIFIPITIIFSTIQVFIPTSKELMLIYGIGGTLDYVKSNDKAKQLPDKCIQVLDEFIDEYLEDNK